MTEPRPEVFVEMYRLAWRYGCSTAELQAAVDMMTPRPRKGRPPSKTYGPLLWAMYGLVVFYSMDRFTAAKRVLSLAGGPVDQHENQVHALVRRFDQCCKEGEPIAATQELYTRAHVSERFFRFRHFWEWSNLPWPPDIKVPTDRETELQMLEMLTGNEIDTAHRNYWIALDEPETRSDQARDLLGKAEDHK